MYVLSGRALGYSWSEEFSQSEEFPLSEEFSWSEELCTLMRATPGAWNN